MYSSRDLIELGREQCMLVRVRTSVCPSPSTSIVNTDTTDMVLSETFCKVDGFPTVGFALMLLASPMRMGLD